MLLLAYRVALSDCEVEVSEELAPLANEVLVECLDFDFALVVANPVELLGRSCVMVAFSFETGRFLELVFRSTLTFVEDRLKSSSL